MITRIISTLSLLLVLSTIALTQIISIDVNLDIQHTLDTVTHFNRNKFVAIHADIGETSWDNGWGDGEGPNFTPDLRDHFLNGYDVYLGRNTGGISWNLNNQIREDSGRNGFADSTDITSTGTANKNGYAADTEYHPYEFRNDQIICTQLHPFYADGQLINETWSFSQTNTPEEPFGTASGEYFGRFIRDHFGSGGVTGQPKPKYAEVVNEPLWHLVDRGSHEPEEVFRFHNSVARQIRKFNNDVVVGGFCTAFPDFEINDFGQWEERWKLFIDMCGDSMDFWTIHLYDFPSISGGQERYRKGSNMEATFDMMEQYSYLSFDVVKPFMISEYGAQMHDYFGAWSPYRDWLHVKSVNSMMMQFMERAHVINKTINFLPVKAIWGTNGVDDTYNHRLMRRTDEPTSYTGDWVYSEMVKNYQLWSDVKGIRVDSKSENPDIMTDAYINGNKVYVILNNLDFVSHNLDLNILGTSETLSSVKIKHLYLDGTTDSDSPALDETTQATAPSSVTIAPEGTYVIEYTYATNITIDESSTEIKYYANEMLQKIVANSAITFNINNISVGAFGEATLRLGVGRSHGLSLVPQVTVNGIKIDVPANFRGGPQTDRSLFFGVLEIPVPYALLEIDNVITVQFADDGGHVSSVSMRTYEFSATITRSWNMPVTGVSVTPETITTGIGQNRQLLVEVTPEDATVGQVFWSSDDVGVATVDRGTGEIIGVAEGSANIIATSVDGEIKDTSIVTVQTDIVPIGVDSIIVTPITSDLVYGDTIQLVAQIYPVDATDDSIMWVSDEPSIASVDDYGLVRSESIGEAVITATTHDGGHTATSSVSVVNAIDPYVTIVNKSSYTSSTFEIGEPLEVTFNYHAGSGNTVSGEGVRVFLRLIDNNTDWNVISDIIVADGLSIGTDSGTHTVLLPTTGLTSTVDLTGGNFYYLFVIMETSSGLSYNDNTFPLDLVIQDATGTPVTGATVVPQKLTLKIGQTFPLAVNISPASATNTDVSWSSDGVIVASVNESTGEVTAISAGTVNIIATTDDGSFKDTCMVTVENGLGINAGNTFKHAGISVYPNPVLNRLYISGLGNANYRVKLFNVMGSELLSTDIANDKPELSVSDLPEGMYILKISEGTMVKSVRFNIVR